MDYRTGFKSHKGTEWDAILSTDWFNTIPVTEPDDEYITRGIGFKLHIAGKEMDVLDRLKPSSVQLQWICKNQTEVDQIDEIFDDFNSANVYVLIFKSSALYWWGYLQPNTSNKPNKYFSLTYTLEAQDSLSLLKSQKIFDNIYPGTVNIGSYSVEVPRHRFGAARTTTLVSTTAWPKNEPTVIEAIYSLLFDLDHTPDGALRVMENWKDIGTYATNPRSGSIWARTTFNVWRFLYTDLPPQNPFGLPKDRRKQVTAFDILNEICQMFALRIFQKDGLYYVVQPEAYENGGPIALYAYMKNPASLAQHPIYDRTNSTTLQNTSDYVEAIPSPPVDPYFVGESSWQKLYAMFAVTMSGSTAGNLMDWGVKQKISATTNNLSLLSTRNKEMATEIPLASIKMTNFNPQLPAKYQIFERHLNGFFWDSYITIVNANLELRNNYRKILTVTLKSPDLDFFKAITYDGVSYIPHDLTFEANLERWKGKWIEIKTDETNLAEAIGFSITKGDTDGFINRLILEWIKKRTA